ncbi:phosphate ABC transporter substrate-binding protein PstS [Nocardioides jishulii]|uniref:Phosphate-binding protein n=1 Tax=Nocardioides jishulii TaxID=2575440 RepID=A0A4V5TKI7_9ACTN|nr:phosphate ABC transporter substrate-binding protein PstS [Nocardioides jishulii]QCX26441.1 phosphate ABC transporter substrate-binding protein PstS [Nocardioides jishulii]TKI63753.1 phosphate ABC transporter substrate-binding protein PstS [Nocardioides jishulii]
MNRTSLRRGMVPGIAALALVLTGCSAANESGSASDGGLAGTLNGGGASSQEAAQNAWRAGYQGLHSDVTVNYDPTGSGGGRENFTSGGFAFAGSDSYLTDDEGELSAAEQRCAGDPIEIPNYVSPIAVVFNVEGVDELNLTPDAIAGIFNGTITRWNDPAIAASNEGVTLPDATITAVHRSDESGTTGNFTHYLSAVAKKAWPHGEVESWPIKAGEGANGTSGVVSAVTNGKNTIGYADASQAGDLGTVNVQVGDDFVGPTAEAAAKILEVSPRVEGRADSSLTFELDYTTGEAGTYPIVLTSYLMACPTYEDGTTADLVKGYLTYVLSDEGQKAAADTAGSAPLPAGLAAEAQALVDGIKAR